MKKIVLVFMSVAMHCAKGENLAEKSIPDPYDYKELVTTEQQPKMVREGLWDFGKAAFGWLEFRGLPAGEYEVVLGEMTNAAGCVANPYPNSSIRCQTLRGRAAAGKFRLPMMPDKLNTKGYDPKAPAICLPEKFGIVFPFRYVQIIQAPKMPKSINLVRVMVHYPIDMTQSHFECDNSVLNEVYEFCKYSILSTSFCGIYVDGDRERTPYEGDAYINQLGHYAIENNYSLARRSHEWLMDFPTWPTEWKQHSIKMAWADWMWSGDSRSIGKYYNALKRKLVGNYPRRDIVDWPRSERDGFVMTESNSVVEAFNCRNLAEMAVIAAGLSKYDEAKDYEARAAAAKVEFRRKFINPETRLVRDGEGVEHYSLHANVAALAFGLVPKEDVAKVVEYINGKGMACSVYFAQYFLEALCEAERFDLAVKYMAASGDRSWKGMIDFGSTISMEAWNVKVKPNLDLNHAWGAAPINIISRYLLGVTPIVAGFSEISIKPRLGGLKFVKGVVPTAKGPVRIELTEKTLKVETPATAIIDDGDFVVRLPAGKYSFKR